MVVQFLKQQTQKQSPSHAHLPLDRIAVIILGGGEGTRLQPLTKTRCKPAISFGGRYTLIDIPISHALLTGLSKIHVIGQYMAHSLDHHLSKSYYSIMDKDLHLLVPGEENERYEGTADAVRKNLDFFASVQADYFLILSGDQLYNIQFDKMIAFAMETEASMVVAAQVVKEKEAKRMGLLRLREGSTQLVEFAEKPKEKEILTRFARGEQNNEYLGSMGIYLFQRKALFDLLLEDLRHDFGAHLIGTELKKGRVHSFIYDGYWEDIGTIDSYYHANLALTKKHEGEGFDCYDEKNMILTQSYHLPGAKISQCVANHSVFCEGAIVEAAEVSNSIIGVRSLIGKNAVIRNSILMGNSDYEGEHMIGEGSLISGAIIDQNVTLGRQVCLLNKARYHTYDHPEGLLYVRDGITIIPSKSILPDYFSF